MKSISAMFVTGLLATGSLCLSSPALAGAKQLNRYHVKVDGRAFRVITYADGTVKVVEGGMFGPSTSITLRASMRQAVSEATHCRITDDFFVDAKLVGTLDCRGAGKTATGSGTSAQ